MIGPDLYLGTRVGLRAAAAPESLTWAAVLHADTGGGGYWTVQTHVNGVYRAMTAASLEVAARRVLHAAGEIGVWQPARPLPDGLRVAVTLPDVARDVAWWQLPVPGTWGLPGEGWVLTGEERQSQCWAAFDGAVRHLWDARRAELTACPAWGRPEVAALRAAVRADRADALPALADALQDGGLAAPEFLALLRAGHPWPLGLAPPPPGDTPP